MGPCSRVEAHGSQQAQAPTARLMRARAGLLCSRKGRKAADGPGSGRHRPRPAPLRAGRLPSTSPCPCVWNPQCGLP
jgi:hypothetical protein